ncbi:hypothetical protein CPB83DRAFT_841102 [Crepidotus variabilis]|uniref:Uncharacterized protein n=1 Tax=Crepidotus variabilis TaxID=179855 RepID=A0A9P6E346_9AGAR|nr:hypothetical protein CPB83DRAFT_841102 [Crepidotus variabilis]
MTKIDLDKVFSKRSQVPIAELWTCLILASKARRGLLAWSPAEDEQPYSATAINSTTTEDILAHLYEGLVMPPIVIFYDIGKMAKGKHVPKVVRGNQIVQALVDFEENFAKDATEDQRDALRSRTLTIVKYNAPNTDVQQRITSLFDHYSAYPKVSQCEVTEKATNGEIIWSKDRNSGRGGPLIDIAASLEDIITDIHDGHLIPPLVLSCEASFDSVYPPCSSPAKVDRKVNDGKWLLPRVIMGNKIVRALVALEEKYKDVTSNVHLSVIRNSELIVIIYDDLTSQQEDQVNKTFEKYFMRNPWCIRCVHERGKLDQLKKKVADIQSIAVKFP